MGASTRIDDMLYAGLYPRIHHRQPNSSQALGDYFETYVERDVRTVGEGRNLSLFERFVHSCAGRVGGLLNLSSIGSDAGVSHTTAQRWLSILKASHVAFRLPPFHANLAKRLVKSPKPYFYDMGWLPIWSASNMPDSLPPVRFAATCSRTRW